MRTGRFGKPRESYAWTKCETMMEEKPGIIPYWAIRKVNSEADSLVLVVRWSRKIEETGGQDNSGRLRTFLLPIFLARNLLTHDRSLASDVQKGLRLMPIYFTYWDTFLIRCGNCFGEFKVFGSIFVKFCRHLQCYLIKRFYEKWQALLWLLDRDLNSFLKLY